VPDTSGWNVLRPTKKLDEFEKAENKVMCDLAWSPDGNTLALGFQDGTIVRWKVGAKSFKEPVKRHQSWVETIDWSYDGVFLVSGSHDQSVCIWNVIDDSVVKYQHGEKVEWVACSPSRLLVASGAWDGTVCFWDLAEQKACHRLTARRRRVTGLAWSSDGATVAVAFQDGLVEVWDPENWIQKHSFPTDSPTHCISLLRDGHSLAVGYNPHRKEEVVPPRVEIIDMRVPHDRGNYLPGFGQLISVTQFSPDGRFLATRSLGGECILWDCSAWKAIASIKCSGNRRTSKGLAFHPGRLEVACLASQFRSIHLFDLNELPAMPAETHAKPSRIRKVLILAANPKGTEHLRLGEEIRKISEAIDGQMGDGQLELDQTWAATANDLHKKILRQEPEIVHFSGHGVGTGGERGIRDFSPPGGKEQSGLIFEDTAGNRHLITSEALGGLFKLFTNHVKCVILNACNSHMVAQEIARHIDYVIAMSQPVSDPAAIHFSQGFYTALRAGKDYRTAFEHGRIRISLEGYAGQEIPILITKT
jgi:hypothetical protein